MVIKSEGLLQAASHARHIFLETLRDAERSSPMGRAVMLYQARPCILGVKL